MKEQVLAFSKKIKQYPILFVCGILLPVGIVILFMRSPKTESANVDLEESERNWQQIQLNLERSLNLEDHLERVNAYAEDISNRLMYIDQVARNYEFFYRLENEVGIEIRQIDQGVAIDKGHTQPYLAQPENFVFIPFNLTLGGEYNDIVRFVELLDHQRYIIRVQSVIVTPDAGPDEPQDNVGARVTCYVLGGKEA